MLFANLGKASAPMWQMGVIALIEGQTANGILMQAESWIGSRQGLQCFGTCTTVERIYSGIVVPTFTIQEEILFIRNVVFAGITFSIRAEFQFYAEPNSTCPNPGFCYVEINSRAKLQPLRLTFNNTVRVGPDLSSTFDYLLTTLQLGDFSMTALLHFYLRNDNRWENQLAEFISTFDPPGFTITSDITFGSIYALSMNSIAKHQIYLSGAVANFQLDIQISFAGLLITNTFNDLWVDLSWRVGSVEFTGSLIFATNYWKAFAFRIKVGF